jgi:hypothetical protein
MRDVNRLGLRGAREGLRRAAILKKYALAHRSQNGAPRTEDPSHRTSHCTMPGRTGPRMRGPSNFGNRGDQENRRHRYAGQRYQPREAVDDLSIRSGVSLLSTTHRNRGSALPDAAQHLVMTIGASGAWHTASMRWPSRIAHERAVVIGMVQRPKPGRSIIAAASPHRSGVKRARRLPVRSAEAEMCPGNRSSQFRLAGDGELDAERSRGRAVIGASAVTEIDDAHEPSGRSA